MGSAQWRSPTEQRETTEFHVLMDNGNGYYGDINMGRGDTCICSSEEQARGTMERLQPIYDKPLRILKINEVRTTTQTWLD